MTLLQFDRHKHSKHPEEFKNLKQFEFEQLLIASIDQFGLVCNIEVLELWVNFDQKDCFLANNLELLLIFLMLVQCLSVHYLLEAVSPNSVCQLPCNSC